MAADLQADLGNESEPPRFPDWLSAAQAKPMALTEVEDALEGRQREMEQQKEVPKKCASSPSSLALARCMCSCVEQR
jgi:hypothetical protein